MLDNNKELFNAFQQLHFEYEKSQEKLQDQFNAEGKKVMEVVREWENKLCMQSEKGGYSSFTPKLAEKFQAEVKKHFPLIDHIGLQIERFSLKKIKLL